MKTLVKNIPITLSSRPYVCDILLGMYITSFRPAIILCESRPSTLSSESPWAGEPIAIASLSAPEAYLQHLSKYHFVMKDYAENSGLWEQLLLLKGPEDSPLFLPTTTAITLGYTRNLVGRLGLHPSALFTQLQEEKSHG